MLSNLISQNIDYIITKRITAKWIYLEIKGWIVKQSSITLDIPIRRTKSILQQML